jgi:hypothetical protein
VSVIFLPRITKCGSIGLLSKPLTFLGERLYQI